MMFVRLELRIRISILGMGTVMFRIGDSIRMRMRMCIRLVFRARGRVRSRSWG